MPSITPSYLYTLVALIVVSSLLVLSFMTYTNAIRFSSEARQLRDLMNHVAAKSTELLTLVLTTNSTVEVFLEMPTAIGNKQYWLQLRNDTAKTWVESGLGNKPVEGSELRVYLPKRISAVGYYLSGHGSARLNCSYGAGNSEIKLAYSNEGGQK